MNQYVSLRNRSWLRRAGVVGLIALAPASSLAQTVFPEMEPNESKAAANDRGAYVLASGDAISGLSTGTATTPVNADATLDYLLVKTAPASLGVYRHRLLLTTTGTAGHSIRLRGRSQSGRVINETSDIIIQTGQTSPPPPRYVQWYGFGKGEQIYVHVSGTTNTTANYLCTLESIPAEVTEFGTYATGDITITTVGQGHTTDTALWVYDGDLNALAGFGNDNAFTTGSPRSTLTRTFAPGTYYLAITAADLSLNLPAPSDDLRHNANATDFANIAVSEATTSTANLSFAITDANGTEPVSTFKTERHIINWFRFTVGTPTLGACCLEDGSCVVTTERLCGVQRGLFDEDTCDASVCASPSACCSHGECHVLSEWACGEAGGVFAGTIIPCPVLCAPAPGVPIPLPPQSSTQTFSSVPVFTRGMWFIAPVDFRITGLRVPDPTAHGRQHVEVVRFADVPPTALEGTNNFVSLFRRTFVPSAAIIGCDIPVSAGQIIGIMGGCGDQASMTSSYGPADSLSSILGSDVTLRRLVMQHNLAVNDARSLSTAGAEIGRIELFVAAPASGACCTASGCAIVTGAGACTGDYLGDDSACVPMACCPGDFNNSGGVDATDIFIFLDAWFDQNGQSGMGLSADVDGSGTVDATDIFVYLDVWFATNGVPCP